MSTLYAYINQEQFKTWSFKAEQPCVEQFLREVGTNQIKFSKEGLSQPFVPIKPGGCVRFRGVQTLDIPSIQIVKHPKESFFGRMKRYFSFE
jgi:hypothetical protein